MPMPGIPMAALGYGLRQGDQMPTGQGFNQQYRPDFDRMQGPQAPMGSMRPQGQMGPAPPVGQPMGQQMSPYDRMLMQSLQPSKGQRVAQTLGGALGLGGAQGGMGSGLLQQIQQMQQMNKMRQMMAQQYGQQPVQWSQQPQGQPQGPRPQMPQMDYTPAKM